MDDTRDRRLTAGNGGRLRILLLAPSGRDGEVAARTFGEAGLAVETCPSMRHLTSRIHEVGYASIGALVVTEESLTRDAHLPLSEALDTQPPWSDLPVVLLAAPSTTLAESRLNEVLAALGNVTLLERPMRRLTLLIAVQVALRQRRRQLVMRELLEEQRRGVELRDHFLAMLGHELRNPLSAIVLAADSVASDPAEAERYREVVSRQAANLSRLVDDILDVSRASRQKLRIEKAPVDLREVSRGAAAAERAAIEEKGLELTVHLPEEAVPVLGDSVRLEQVVHNLLSNAARFTPPDGMIEVRVWTERGRALLRVSDTGEGIPKERLDQIFDLFAQVDEEVRRHRGGLGLGLPLVQQIVGLHDGKVEAESEGPGKGSAFTVSIPLRWAAEEGARREGEGARPATFGPEAKERGEEAPARAGEPTPMEVVEEPEPVPPELRPAEDREPTPRPEPEAAPPEPAPRRAPRAPGRREARPAPRKAREKVRPTAPEPGAPRVLVVEDEADNRELLVLLLRRRGIEVHAAANGTEGVRLMREISPDVGLIDIGLPDLDGYEVGRRARSLLGEKILLVALTGYGHPQARRRTKEAGFDVHLTKPVDMKRLVAMIKERAGGEQPAAPPP